ncbi:MAG: hypothetical protein QXP17_02080 [Candidatus Jordarchaeales archaeon]
MDVSRYLSLKRVTLFFNGGALMEYEGQIPVKDEDTLYMMAVDLNIAEQVFSTLNVSDLDGGAVTEIVYQLPAELSCSYDVKFDNFMRSLLPKLVGRTISLGVKSGENISGILLGFDETKNGGNDEVFLDVLSSDKLYRVNMASVEHISLGKNCSLELKNLAKGELKAYVGWRIDPGTVVKEKHLVNVKHFQSLGEKWRPFYHLYVSDEMWVLIVWCEITNPTSKDWKDVSITLTTGAMLLLGSCELRSDEVAEYNITGPVTIPKFSRVLIPVSKFEVKGEVQLQTGDSEKNVVKVSIINDSGKVWLPGKIIVWREGRLLGIGELQFVKKGGVAGGEVSVKTSN